MEGLYFYSSKYRVTKGFKFHARPQTGAYSCCLLLLLPSHIPGLGNSYFWRKQSNDCICNAELTTRGALGPKLNCDPLPTQQVALVGPSSTTQATIEQPFDSLYSV